eukprot:CAMPEP_0198150242 /NCGR_PEP_ID=MMETSP1443-20131203/49995_1 /TAXON_ID=186043 /ORGANISM="Entomoneis sp., Strain CCMP2396" /LENGTH=44 /DNA_ID= /DNA_START= /DNA_END= /DNA_ORIENTATION=
MEAADEYSAMIDTDGNSQKKKTLMPGSHKHLGGAYDPKDGCIYG